MLPEMSPRMIGCTATSSVARHATGDGHEVGATVGVLDGMQHAEQVAGVVMVRRVLEARRAVGRRHLVVARKQQSRDLVAGAVLATCEQKVGEPLLRLPVEEEQVATVAGEVRA